MLNICCALIHCGQLILIFRILTFSNIYMSYIGLLIHLLSYIQVNIARKVFKVTCINYLLYCPKTSIFFLIFLLLFSTIFTFSYSLYFTTLILTIHQKFFWIVLDRGNDIIMHLTLDIKYDPEWRHVVKMQIC